MKPLKRISAWALIHVMPISRFAVRLFCRTERVKPCACLCSQKAKKLLKETDDKVYQISEQVGYDDFRYFCKVFKAKENISPSEYRNL